MKQKILQSRSSETTSPSADSYSLDSLSINASFRRRRNRKSARSYLNHAFSDQVMLSLVITKYIIKSLLEQVCDKLHAGIMSHKLRFLILVTYIHWCTKLREFENEKKSLRSVLIVGLILSKPKLDWRNYSQFLTYVQSFSSRCLNILSIFSKLFNFEKNGQ